METIKQYLERTLKKALHLICDTTALTASVKVSDRPDLCDYQSNIALQLAKTLKKTPQILAKELCDAWTKKDYIAVSVAGPGFLNFQLKNEFIESFLNQQLNHEKLGFHFKGPQQKILIDYGGPNAAKPMHVGHLRSSIIGDALKRLYKFAGHHVLGDIHLGDWGTQMGMLLVGLKEKHPDWIYFDPIYTGPYPKESPITLEDLEDLYPDVSQRAKDSPDLAQACRQATHELQQGRPGYRALWAHFVDVSVQAMKNSFQKLGISFELWYGESRYQEKLKPLVNLFLEKGLATKSDGAIIVRVAREGDKTEIPPLLLQKTDGGFLYATTDMATVQERYEDFKVNKALYVVDRRQQLHLEQVFRAAQLIGWDLEMSVIGFGTMNGPDGKPFKTRSGGVMKLSDLISQLEIEALKRINEQVKLETLTEGEKQEIATQIGISALKFADLQHDPKQNYQFDIEKFMRFEGKTGPYIQYAAVRIQSLIDKGRLEKNLDVPGMKTQLNFSNLTEPLHAQERSLMLHLCRFPELINDALTLNAPNILCEAAYQLAQAFSAFYAACPILSLDPGTVQTNRLSLCVLTLKAITFYLSLLGIEIPKKM
jgi:arginyl-tRNA synthetase